MIHNGASLPGSAVPLDLACECNESGEKKEVIARWFNAVTEAGTPNYLTLTGSLLQTLGRLIQTRCGDACRSTQRSQGSTVERHGPFLFRLQTEKCVQASTELQGTQQMRFTIDNDDSQAKLKLLDFT